MSRLEHILLAFCLFLSFNLSGQQDINEKDFKAEEKRYTRGDLLIKYSPLNILDLNMPSIDLGISYFPAYRIGIQLKYGQKLDVYRFDDPYKMSGFKVLLEGQYFINRYLYISVETGFHRNYFSDEMEYFPSAGDSLYIVDKYHVNDKRFTITPKAGYVLLITSHLSVDFYAGIGTQYHLRRIDDLEFDPLKGNEDAVDFYEWVGPTYNELDEWNMWLTFGLNINWKL
jgi:hypothetical protein